MHYRKKILILKCIMALALISIFGLTFMSVMDFISFWAVCLGYTISWWTYYWAENKIKKMRADNRRKMNGSFKLLPGDYDGDRLNLIDIIDGKENSNGKEN